MKGSHLLCGCIKEPYEIYGELVKYQAVLDTVNRTDPLQHEGSERLIS